MILHCLPSELRSKIYYFSLSSPFENNPNLKRQIEEEATSPKHRFRRMMDSAKKQTRRKIKKRQREKVAQMKEWCKRRNENKLKLR